MFYLIAIQADFLGKSAIALIAVALSVSVCVSATFVRTAHIFAKITNIKNEVYTFQYLPSNGAIAEFVPCDPFLLFQDQIFKMLE